MKIRMGQLLVGQLSEGGRSKVFAVKTISTLRSGDVKAWLVCFDDGAVIEAEVRFPGGEPSGPWRHIDLNNSSAMLARVTKELQSVVLSKGATEGGIPVEFKIPPDKAQELALKCMRAAFRAT